MTSPTEPTETPIDNGDISGRVERLDHTAAALRAVLERVEDNQTTLIRLHRDVASLRVEKAPRTEVTAHVEQIEEQRRKDRLRAKAAAFTGTVIGILVVGGLLLGFFAYKAADDRATAKYVSVQQNICATRNRQAQVFGQYLDDALKEINSDPKMTAADRALAAKQAAQLRQVFVTVDCSKLRNP